MKRYAHVFFDLDHTLWDFRTNSRETLRELHADMGLHAFGIEDVDQFIDAYEEINAGLWKRYEQGQVNKAVMRILRFDKTLQAFGVRDERLASNLGNNYLDRCPRRSALNPGVSELLDKVCGKVRLHVITNGFHEVQQTKMASSGLSRYFDVVLTSEQAGAGKPDPRIFESALQLAGATAEVSIMVGDDALNDTGGARAAGIDQAHYAPDGTDPDPDATYRFSHFRELIPILS